VPQACHGWSETIATYRFFDNEKVSPIPLTPSAKHLPLQIKQFICASEILRASIPNTSSY
jgi:hypothetical protein